MGVITFTSRTKGPLVPAAAAPPVVVTGALGSPSGRAGTFVGSYRLERCLSQHGQLAAAGVFTGELTDVDGSRIGIGARRVTVVACLVTTATGLLVQVGPLDVDLLGLVVGMGEVSVDVRGTCCEDSLRAALELVRPACCREGDALWPCTGQVL